ncbi:hypothetical protein B808_1054 [Fructilactobacillus florum 8D]|uniref:Uncharacterized protein n=1 Tax=Fructilactobacillus florum 8D TaxID=1221538 RepID=W9ED46_9LACO|nr:hypothetical protein B808_1054 [Fructilactobacillus florum 8D]
MVLKFLFRNNMTQNTFKYEYQRFGYTLAVTNVFNLYLSIFNK